MINLNLSDETLRNLTNSDMNILSYIYQHIDEVITMDVKTLASSIPCSSSSVIRLCKKIGFSGFPELKFFLKQEKTTSVNNKTGNGEILSFDEIIRNLKKDIKGSLSLVSSEELVRTSEILHSNIPVFVFMPGGITDNIANYFVQVLMRRGRQYVYPLHSTKMAKHKISSLSSDSILVLISASGKWAKTIELAKLAHMHGMKIISFTPYTESEIAKYSDYNLRFFTEERMRDGAEFTSRVAIFYIIDALAQYLDTFKKGDDQHE